MSNRLSHGAGMSVSGGVVVFAAGLLVVFAAALGIGSLVDPADTKTGATDEGGGHAPTPHGEGSPKAPSGLGVAEGGYSLRFASTVLGRGEDRELRFSIADADGEPVTDYDELHERRMHLIVVRRDGAAFRHLHPEMDQAGNWTVPIELTEAGVYRAFADFSVGGEQPTLAADLFVSGGNFEARPFPAPAPIDSTSGYEVRLHADKLRAGESSSLTFTVSRDGEPVDDLAPYLGAKGHLVALREGDLAFLHVHPEEPSEEHGHGGHSEAGTANEIAFAASFPTAGLYRLYLQFKQAGSVRTAQFTVGVSR